MNRRDAVLTMLALGASVGSLRARAQTLRRIGLLLLSSECPASRELVSSLAALGWIEGRTITFDCTSSLGRMEQIPSLAAKLVARRPDVIVSQAIPGIRALLAATSSIPIVALQLADPVGQGLIKSLSRPAGNLTGIVSVLFDVEAKRIQLLKEVLPSLSRLAVMIRKEADARYRASVEQMLASTSKRYGFRYQWIDVGSYDEFPRLIDQLAPRQFDAIYFPPNPLAAVNPRALAEAALRQRLPTIGQGPELSDAGVLLTYGPNTADVAQRAANYVDKILRGAKPADLPFEQPTKFDFVINMKTAKALGITIPASVLLRADRVIE